MRNSNSLQRTALAINHLGLCPWRDGNRAPKRRSRRYSASASGRGGASGDRDRFVGEAGGEGAADLEGD